MFTLHQADTLKRMIVESKLSAPHQEIMSVELSKGVGRYSVGFIFNDEEKRKIFLGNCAEIRNGEDGAVKIIAMAGNLVVIGFTNSNKLFSEAEFSYIHRALSGMAKASAVAGAGSGGAKLPPIKGAAAAPSEAPRVSDEKPGKVMLPPINPAKKAGR